MAIAIQLDLPLAHGMPIEYLAQDVPHRMRREATEHQLTEAELGTVRESSPLGVLTRRATPIERLAANIHGLVTAHADPTPAELAKLIAEAIGDAAIARIHTQTTGVLQLGCAFEHDGKRCGWTWPEHPAGPFYDGRAFPEHHYRDPRDEAPATTPTTGAVCE
jgi:hypothetical protein